MGHAMLVVLFIAALLWCNGLRLQGARFVHRKRVSASSLPIGITTTSAKLSISPTIEEERETRSLLPPTTEDMQKLAFILANITDHLDNQPETSMSVVSQELGWLYQRDVPKLTQMMLQELPELRKDKGMMRGYLFLLDFLEAVGGETTKRIRTNQELLKGLLESTKLSEAALDEYIASKADQLLAPDFKVYLESEIEEADFNSKAQNLLVTIQLRLLDEEGKKLGVDVMLLPKLAAEADPAELRRKATQHLMGYDAVGRRLFLQTLRIMLAEMKKRYTNVDPLFLLNLQEVEKIALGLLGESSTAHHQGSDFTAETGDSDSQYTQ